MTGRLRLVLGDQLTRGLASLADLDRSRDVVLMVEVAEEATHVRHHKQKIAFLLSAMRHFARELQAEGIVVDYVRLDDPGNTHSFGGELRRALSRHAPQEVVLTEPGEWRVAAMMREWQARLPCPVTIRPDTRFLCPIEDFSALTAAGKTGRMEYFYREMRRRTGLLMEGSKPVGGAWNLDHENRKALPRGTRLPQRLRFAPDALTREVIALVAQRFPDHFGALEPFGWAVTRADALRALAHFLDDALPRFGDYQDAMKTGEDFLFHGLISPYLNAGLLTADEVCRAAEARWQAGEAPLNAVEGFIRQILGWREFVRGLYWTRMPQYAATNHLQATRPLPSLYWTGRTGMRCLAECVATTQRHAYAHHIQRLMVLGNFALLAGVAPAQLEEWFLAVYADAYEWVELPNVHGMVLHADGGLLGSKPYAASGAYINRMSDYCRGCQFDPGQRLGPQACPFNALYWAFLDRNEARLGRNGRMMHPYRMLRAMDAGERSACVQQAHTFLDGLDRNGQDTAADQPRLDPGW